MNEGGMWNRSKEGQYGKVIFIVTKKVRIRRVYRRNSFGILRLDRYQFIGLQL